MLDAIQSMDNAVNLTTAMATAMTLVMEKVNHLQMLVNAQVGVDIAIAATLIYLLVRKPKTH